MKTWLHYWWERWRTSYWFIPTIMALGAACLAFATLTLDQFFHEHAAEAWGWRYLGGADGARAVLATVAGTMITVAATVFSITMVTLSLASAQFGPRLLRTFIRDRRSHFVLGVFVATFTYCLLVLRTIRGSDHDLFVPGISVAIGFFGGLLGVGVLIFFINHVAISIQAPQVIAAVTAELCETIDRLWPDNLGDDPPAQPNVASLIADLEAQGTAIRAQSSGYVDAINDAELLQWTQKSDLLVQLDIRPGHFIVRDQTIARVYPAKGSDDELKSQLNRALVVTTQRTPFQDVEFAIDQLVEVAIRALSPGVNDPFTAINCIDRLGEALCRLLGRTVPSPLRFDGDKRLRVIAHPASFGNIADASFNQIRQYGRTSAAVMIRMLETLTVVAEQARRAEDLVAIRRHAELVRRAAHEGLYEEWDRQIVEERFNQFQQAADANPAHNATRNPAKERHDSGR